MLPSAMAHSLLHSTSVQAQVDIQSAEQVRRAVLAAKDDLARERDQMDRYYTPLQNRRRGQRRFSCVLKASPALIHSLLMLLHHLLTFRLARDYQVAAERLALRGEQVRIRLRRLVLNCISDTFHYVTVAFRCARCTTVIHPAHSASILLCHLMSCHTN
jgi:hypothetical protein